VIAYHLLKHPHRPCQDLGPAHLDLRDRGRAGRRPVKRLEALGCRVALDPAAA
jgi:hypothetical protein